MGSTRQESGGRRSSAMRRPRRTTRSAACQVPASSRTPISSASGTNDANSSPSGPRCAPAKRSSCGFEGIRAMADELSYPYATHLNIYYAPLERIDVQALVEACTDQWYNQTLCRVNDSVVRLGVLQGEYHWHKHDDEDEFFYVVEGRFLIDLEGRTVEVVHRTRAPERAVILMVEGAGIIPTGD